MDNLKLDHDDYIALYYTREEEPNDINRLMIFGTSSNIEDDLANATRTGHERTLMELIEYDFIFQKG
jgi:hypothetical protein